MNDIPAFPVLLVDRPKELSHHNGMTLRDYFAAKAMQAFCSTLGDASSNSPPYWNVLAVDAYVMADEMMEARKK